MGRFIRSRWFIVPALLLALSVVSAYEVRSLRRQRANAAGDRLLYADAMKDERNGDFAAATEKLARYTAAHPQNLDAWSHYADTLEKSAKSPEDHVKAFHVHEQIVLRDSTRISNRRKAAGLGMQLRLYNLARPHLEALLESAPGDAAIEVALAQCLEAAGDYDKAAEHYESAVNANPSLVDAFTRYAAMSAKHPRSYPDPRAILERCVAANPASARAYLERGRLLIATDHRAAGIDIARARELDPASTDGVLASVELAEASELQDDARKTLDDAIKANPTEGRLYLARARLDLTANHTEDALTVLRSGSKSASEKGDVNWVLANVLLSTDRLDESDRLIEGMRKNKLPDPLIKYLDGRALVSRKKWREAISLLVAARGQLAERLDPAGLPMQTDLLLAQCYRELGELAKGETSLRRALEADPKSVLARTMLASTLAEQGNTDRAIELYRPLFTDIPEIRPAFIGLLIRRTLEQPPATRRWDDVKAVVDRMERLEPGSVNVGLARARLLVVQDQLTEAQKVLTGLRDRKPEAVEPWLALAEISDLLGKYEEILVLLDAAVTKLGDRAPLRMARSAYLSAHAVAAAPAELARLEKGLESFTPMERTRVSSALATAYNRIGAAKDAERLWDKVATDDPTNVNALLSRLVAALRDGDDIAASRSIDGLKAIEGQDGPLFSYASAIKIIAAARRGAPANLEEARSLLNKASQGRPRWPRVPVAQGELDEITGDRSKAIRDYQTAVNLGETEPAVVRRLVSLLYGTRRFDEADRVVKALRMKSAVPEDLQRMADRIATRSEPIDAVIASAKAAVASGSKDVADYLWLASALRVAGRNSEVEPVLRQALSLDGGNAGAWTALVTYLAQARRMKDAEAAVAEASEKLKNGGQISGLAACQEIVGHLEKAEEIYRTELAARPDDTPLLRTYSAFCLRAGKLSQADKSLQALVAQGAKAPEVSGWAKRIMAVRHCEGAEDAVIARVFAELARESSREDDREDVKRLQGLVLAAQPGQPRRKEAIRLLEEVAAAGYATASDEFLLARLYDEDRNWKRAEELLSRLLENDRNNVVLVSTMARGLLRHNGLERARLLIARLKELSPDSLATAEVEVRALAADGKEEEAVAVLEKMTQGKPLEVRARAAHLLEELGGYAPLKAAEEILRSIAADAKAPVSCLALAAFLTRHGRTAEALAICDKAWDTNKPEPVAAVCEGAVNRPDATETQRQAYGARLEAALRDNPKSAFLLARLAQLRQVQGRFEEAAAGYRKAIEINPRDISALNNLAWVLVQRGDKGPEPAERIGRAIEIAGPISELLDTRAKVFLAAGQFDAASRDLEQAIAATPKATSWFHLAQVHFARGDRVAASNAYRKAVDLGLTSSGVEPIERESFEKLSSQVVIQK